MDGIILVNKPQGFTSHDLVMKARRALGTSKIGHTGTLDPDAEGLMMLVVGKATKILPYIAIHDKQYLATLLLGTKTDTLDTAGTVLETREVRDYSDEEIRAVLDSFLGPQKQVPPMYSAKKVNGKKLYELARHNVEIEREPVDIEIKSIELVSHEGSRFTFRTEVSSGTYIRVLCSDLAERLGTIGCMASLVRESIDRFHLEDACTLEELAEGNYQLLSTYDVLYQYPYCELDELADVYNGKPLQLDTKYDFVFITSEKKIIAAYERGANGLFYCRRGLW